MHTFHTISRTVIHRRRSLTPLRFLLAATFLTISACAGPVGYRERGVVSAPPPAPPVRVYFYPKQGQSPTQQDRDRYECSLWATKQTGFNPSAPQIEASQRVVVEPVPPPGHDTAVGAATGAILGAAVSRPREAGEGAVVGAIAGAMVGAASDASRQEQAQRIQEGYDQRAAQRSAYIGRQAQAYRRAMAACLEGRGYSVQ